MKLTKLGLSRIKINASNAQLTLQLSEKPTFNLRKTSGIYLFKAQKINVYYIKYDFKSVLVTGNKNFCQYEAHFFPTCAQRSAINKMLKFFSSGSYIHFNTKNILQTE